jgi:hypothetical protein
VGVLAIRRVHDGEQVVDLLGQRPVSTGRGFAFAMDLPPPRRSCIGTTVIVYNR